MAGGREGRGDKGCMEVEGKGKEKGGIGWEDWDGRERWEGQMGVRDRWERGM